MALTAVFLEPCRGEYAYVVVINGATLDDADERTHVIVVTETGARNDHLRGRCVAHPGMLPPVRALLSCTLFSAIHYANGLSAEDQAIILLAPGHYVLYEPLPRVTRDVEIRGSAEPWKPSDPASEAAITLEGGRGHFMPEAHSDIERVTIDGMQQRRIFDFAQNVHVGLRHLTLTNGFADLGGAVRQGPGGRLVLHNVSIHLSRAAYGGAVYSESTLHVTRSGVLWCEASLCGGAVYTSAQQFDAHSSLFSECRDACSRRPPEVVLTEAVRADGRKDVVIAVGPAISLSADTWATERKRMREADDANLHKLQAQAGSLAAARDGAGGHQWQHEQGQRRGLDSSRPERI